MRWAAMVLAGVLLLLVGWLAVYPSSSDPKNIKYVLWKAGLYRLNVDAATAAMAADPGRDKLVLGKTKAQLRQRFGSLLSPTEVSPYYRDCHERSSWKAKDVFFIGHGPWMVVFDGDKATELVLCKGY